MGCHLYFTSHPTEHFDWQIERLGGEIVSQLKMKAYLYKKKDRALEVIFWKQELDKLNKKA